ncbi:hypothetical protein [Paenibacillus sp. HW567]|uniref:hypothetical protein n=1 Tax=Paenibacillus sp. HW567 TaxID=1034769 RepID=UPI0012EC4F4E|nr:hypothetical protein [Paenibacillus sp. HW567]
MSCADLETVQMDVASAPAGSGHAIDLAAISLSNGTRKLPVLGKMQDFSLENVDGKQVTGALNKLLRQ